jgi:ribonuclease HII
MKYFLGIDEARRGPTLGPLVLGGVLCTKKAKELFKKIGVTDSKLLSHKKRVELAKRIKEHTTYEVSKASPQRIDKALTNPSSSLTYLEADMTAVIIKNLIKTIPEKDHKLIHIMIDLPSKNKESYLNYLAKKINNKNIILNAEFKADLNHVEVGAASILAKTTGDKAIENISKKLNIGIGSGYPSDPYTKEALQKHLKVLEDANVLRMTWQTIKNIKQKKSQKSLNSFLK